MLKLGSTVALAGSDYQWAKRMSYTLIQGYCRQWHEVVEGTFNTAIFFGENAGDKIM
jgi:hypothetical protein